MKTLSAVITLTVLSGLALHSTGAQNVRAHPTLDKRDASESALISRRDKQAMDILTKAIQQMGGKAPKSSVATGTVQIVAGSLAETGTVRIQTLDNEQIRQDIQGQRTRTVSIYSNGKAAMGRDDTTLKGSVELAASGRCASFPLPYLVSAVTNGDSSFAYVGLEDVGEGKAYHIRLWDTFSRRPHQRELAELSVRDIWIDVATWLPARVSYAQQPVRGGINTKIPVSVSFSDYRKIEGIYYPYKISESFNGTPVTTITIESVRFDLPVDESAFTFGKGK